MRKYIALTILIYFQTNSLFIKFNKLNYESALDKASINCLIGNTMRKYNNREVVLRYLKLYECKDIKGISDIFSNDILLRDWKICVQGKEKALLETKKNFDAVDAIKIEVLALYENENTVAAELKIIINNKEELYVVDVITINSESKINSIKAFIGRGN